MVQYFSVFFYKAYLKYSIDNLTYETDVRSQNATQPAKQPIQNGSSSPY